MTFIHILTASTCLAALLCGLQAQAGFVECRDGKTIIHVKAYELPESWRTDPATRSQLAVIKEFKRRFPALFAEKYKAKYEADPALRGRFDWSQVEVELDRFSSILVEGVETDLLAIAGGIAPDILKVNFRKSDTYIRNGFLFPLDSYLDQEDPEELEFRVNPKLWPVINRIGPDGAKHRWALPSGGALGKVLLYRKDIFDRYNVPYPTKEWNWDNLLDACRRTTDPAAGVHGIMLTRGKHESWYWTTFLWSAGGEVMEYDEGKDQWRCVFDSQEAAVALDFYTRLCAERWTGADGKVRRGYSSKDDPESQNKWERGEVAMQLGYVSERLLSTIDPDLVGMCPVPLGPAGFRAGELNSRMVGLYSQISDPVVRDAAWEYIWFLGGPEAAAAATRTLVEMDMGQFVNPKYLEMFGYSEIKRLSPKGWEEAYETAIATGRPEPYGTNSNVAYNMMTLPLQRAEQLALADELPAEEEARLEILRNLLKDACADANEVMMGRVSPQDRVRRRVAAAVALGAIAFSFLLAFRWILRVFAEQERFHAMGRPKLTNVPRFLPWLLLLPALLSILAWQYIPVARGTAMAFLDYKLIGQSMFVGLDNLGDVLYDSFWWTSVWNAFRYSFLVIILTFAPPVALAVLLQEVPRASLLFRIVYYLPAVATGIVTILLWRQLFDSSERGAFNAILTSVPAIVFLAVAAGVLLVATAIASSLRHAELPVRAGLVMAAGLAAAWTAFSPVAGVFFPHGETFLRSIAYFPAHLFDTIPEPYHWLTDPDTAMFACVLPMLWAGLGPGCLIYLAALKTIPDDFYEAADIDGATFADKVLFVALPSIKTLIMINFIGVFIASWYNAAANVLVMTGGAAGTETAGLHIWYKAFTYLKFGPATTMAWILGCILVGFTLYQLKLLARVEFKSSGGQ